MRTALAAFVAATTLLVVAPADAASFKPCKYEDSANCVWDARHMGNGSGRSFIADRDGNVTYVSHRQAHRLVHAS